MLRDEKTIDFIGQIQRNESVTYLDMRENSGYDKVVRFKLSLIMLRNIEKLRMQGVMVKGAWLNKEVLMMNETINQS